MGTEATSAPISSEDGPRVVGTWQRRREGGGEGVLPGRSRPGMAEKRLQGRTCAGPGSTPSPPPQGTKTQRVVLNPKPRTPTQNPKPKPQTPNPNPKPQRAHQTTPQPPPNQ